MQSNEAKNLLKKIIADLELLDGERLRIQNIENIKKSINLLSDVYIESDLI